MALAAEGASKMEIAGTIGISRKVLYEWIANNQDFRDIIEHAEAISQVWWEKQARTSLRDKDFNATLFNKQIAGRFRADWRDTSGVQQLGRDGDPIDPPTQIVIAPVCAAKPSQD